MCFGLGTAISGADTTIAGSRFETRGMSEATAVLGYLLSINVLVLLFNLIPGFPLDGGRIARAIAWWKTGDRNRATRFAARLGRGIAFLMIGLGVLLFLTQRRRSPGCGSGSSACSSPRRRGPPRRRRLFAGRIEGLRVEDVMDAEPVAIPETLPLDRAEDEFFLRYGWPWFPVVDATGRLVGVVSKEAVDSVAEQVRGSRPVASVMARDDGESGLRVGTDESLETLLTREGLARLGAIMAVDGDGVLRGIVTVDQVRRALRPA